MYLVRGCLGLRFGIDYLIIAFMNHKLSVLSVWLEAI